MRPIATHRDESRRFGSANCLRVASLLTLAVWTLLLAGALLAQCGIRPSTSLLAALLLGTLLAAAARPRRVQRRRGAWGALWALGLLAGLLSYPAWVGLIAAAGLALGLAPRAPVPAGAGDALAWVAAIGLAPVLEELLYRERLLPALERHLGLWPALVLSSAAFALPHIEPWALLATFLVGLALGIVMKLGGAVALCIGCHTGLNLAALLRGVPPSTSPAAALVSAGLAALALLAAIALARRSGPRRGVVAPRLAPASAAVLALVCLLPQPAHAAWKRWEGTLSVSLLNPAFPPLVQTGTGVSTLNGSSGASHLSTLRLAGGFSSAASTVPVTDPEVTMDSGILGIQLLASLGTASLAPFAGSTGQPLLTRSTLPVRGLLRLCFLDPGCQGSALTLALSQGPSAAVGVGGLLTAGGSGSVRVSVAAGPWTVGTAFVTVTTRGGATFAVPAGGWVHGAASFTTSTAQTGGALSLVTPLQAVSDDAEPFSGFGRLTVRFVPEPGRSLLLGTGVLALAALGRLRRRP